MDAMSLPTAAARLGRTADSLRWLLRHRPDLDRTIHRVGGRRVFAGADLDAIRAAYAARSRRTTTPESHP